MCSTQLRPDLPGTDLNVNIHIFQFLHYPLLEFCGLVVFDEHISGGVSVGLVSNFDHYS